MEQAHRGRQYIAHYAAAVQVVNKRVANLVQTVSDDTIAAILLLACDVRRSPPSLLEIVLTRIKARVLKCRKELFATHEWLGSNH